MTGGGYPYHAWLPRGRGLASTQSAGSPTAGLRRGREAGWAAWEGGAPG